MRNHLCQSNNRGFTIIETLVAITILMVAIAGPLSVANKGLTAALFSRDQMIATYLAQESMEIIKDTKNNNVFNNNTDWLATGDFSLTDLWNCDNSTPSRCDAGLMNNGSNGHPFVMCVPGGCPLYLESGSNGYVANIGVTPTLFTRYFYLSAPGAPGTPCSSALSECTVTVVVNWNEGSVGSQVTLTSEITNQI